MRKVKIIGGAVTKFGRHLDRNMKSLAAEAVTGALEDAGITKEQLQCAWVGNSVQGLFDGQESIRGQVVLSPLGIGGIPVINVENACASSATALNGAWAQVALGEMDVALVLGMEKMFMTDKSKSLALFIGGTDVGMIPEIIKTFKKAQESLKEERGTKGDKEKVKRRSGAMDFYAIGARAHMKKYGSTQRQLAVIASKNHYHSTMNPLAQYQKEFTVEEVLNDVEVAYPLTRAMCAPVGDGAAAAIICSEDFAKKVGTKHITEIGACVLASGETPQKDAKGTLTKLAEKAYEKAGLGPQDIDLAEVHDATAFGELYTTESLLFCPEGEGGSFAEAGHSTLGGKLPINVSGGLESQGHPIGATGIRQVVELFWHLTNRVGKRQVEGAKVGLAQNAGGILATGQPAALSVTILKV